MKNKNLSALSIALLFAAAFASLSSPALAQKAPPPGVVAAIGELTGSVTIRSGATSAAAKVGDVIPAGSNVVSGRGSSATIAFSDGTKVRLGPNANFKLEEAAAKKVSIFAVLGKLEFWVKKAPRSFQVRTPVAVCSVRGTVFALAVMPKGGVDFKLFSGSLAVMDSFGKSLTLNPGQSLVTSASGASSAPAPLPPSARPPTEPNVPLPPPPLAMAPPPLPPPPPPEDTKLPPPPPPPNPTQETNVVSPSSP